MCPHFEFADMAPLDATSGGVNFPRTSLFSSQVATSMLLAHFSEGIFTVD